MNAGDSRAPVSAGTGDWRWVAAAMFCCGWGGNQFTPLLIMYRADGYSAITVDALLGAYVVGLIPGLLLAGGLSDRYGRKPVMLAGTALSLLASLLMAMGVHGEGWIAAGRVLGGVGVGVAMSVGSAWVKELSDAAPGAASDAGTRRGALWLTLGLGLGPGVAGVLAQWGPWPMVLPYLVHAALVVAVLPLAASRPETRAAAGGGGSRFGAVRHPRFRRVILPMAPWIFGASAVAYAIMPQLVDGRLGSWDLPYATLLTVCTLGAGALVQPLARRLDRATSARAVIISMVTLSGGLALSAVAAKVGSPLVALGAAVVLGVAFGIAVVSGLLELQRLARPEELAGLIGVFYALAYIGFLVPTLLAVLAGIASYPVLLACLAAVSLTGTVVIMRHSRAHLPGEPAPAQ